jgi:tetraacyldisaccharide 4'-kinase
LFYGLGYWFWRLSLTLRGASPTRLAEVHIVSIGNLAVGGSGKTPLALAVARYHLGKGRRVFFLSRGYGRKGGQEPLVVSDGKGRLASAEAAGDEPWMLAQSCPRAGLIVDRDRLRAGRLAQEKFRAQVLVLDDGFQRRFAVHRDLELLAWNPSHRDHAFLLPKGVLREPLSQARQAGWLVVTGKSNGLPSSLAEIPKMEAQWQAQSLKRWGKKDRKAPSFLKGKALGALSGLAEPEGFEASLRGLGGRIVLSERYPDHYWFQIPDLERSFENARKAGALLMVTTEKDATRLPQDFRPSLPLWVLQSALKFSQPKAWAGILEQAWRASGQA